MKAFIALGFGIWMAQVLFSGAAQANDLPVCNQDELHAYAPSAEEIEAHRRFTLPFISYPFSEKRNASRRWGFALTVRVDETGAIVCYSSKERFMGDPVSSVFGDTLSLDDQRRDVINKFKNARYTPFVEGGGAIVSEQINEREAPEKHVPLPDVPLGKVRITLEWGGYKVDIYGDGRVIYKGVKFVDVDGEHSYRVPPEEVGRLIESLRVSDIWSLRSSYSYAVTDYPVFVLTVDMGGEVKRFEDYAGERAGMPSSVSDFQREVDKVARSDMWIRLSREALEHLKAEGYNFASPAGAELLDRAIANEFSHDDEAILDLIALGAPITENNPHTPTWYSLLVPALKEKRVMLIDPLVKKGALKANGKPDQSKINAAFHAAIMSGSLAFVEKIWQSAGGNHRPACTFLDTSSDGSARKRSPVSLKLFPPRNKKAAWDGLAITKWLVARGCDIKAASIDGTTLLHRAAESGDVDFVRYLVGQGLDMSARRNIDRKPALYFAENEEIALILLEAGTDLSESIRDHIVC
jgi:hypothetical protein